MTPKHQKWVFFDLDGTLIDSLPPLYKAYRHFLLSYGVRPSPAEFLKLHGPSIPEIVAILQKKYHLKDSYSKNLDRYVVYAKEALMSTKEKTGAVRAIKGLKKKGIRTGLVTTSISRIAVPLVRRSRWGRLMDIMIFGEEAKRGKPSPEIYKKALKKAACKVTEAVAVEDSANGVLSARGAGLQVIGISGKERQKLLKAGAVKTTANITEAAHEAGNLLEYPDVYKPIWTGKVLTAQVAGKRPSNTDGHIFSAKSLKKKGSRIDIQGKFVPYGMFLAGLQGQSAVSPVKALAVSGISFLRKRNKKFYLLGKRSNQVSTYRGYWELAPSGGLDGSCLQKDGMLDYRLKLQDECEEESGLEKKMILRISVFAVLYDSAVHTYDVCCEMQLSACVTERDLRPNTDEYSEMKFLDQHDVDRMFHQEALIVPTSRVLWKVYQKSLLA